MKKILIVIALLLGGIYASAQTNITGTLTDGEEALPMADVLLHKMPDTAYIKGVSTDDNGNFTIKDVEKGNYMIKVSYIGYDDFSKKIYIDGVTKEFKLGNIVLKAGIMLKNATVTGKATAVTIKGDTVEYNPNAYKLQDNAVVEDLLKKLPGVQVDKDGSITAGGKEVSKVLLGGKEFFANDPTLATKNVPVKIVERVQVLDRKSEQERLTGISDGQEETVINLEIKKGQQQGWMGNINTGLGSDIKNEAGNKARLDESVFINRLTANSRFTLISNFNNTNSGRGGRNTFGGTSGNTTAGMGGIDIATFATDKLTVEGSGYFTYRNTDVERSSNTETFLRDTASLQDSSFYTNAASLSDSYNRNYNANVRFTYKPNDYNTIIFRPQGSISNSDSYSTSESTTLGGDLDTANTSQRNSRTESQTTSYGAELNYSHKFGTSGRNLSFEIQYSGSNTKGHTKSDSRTKYYKTDSIVELDQLSNNKNTSTTYRFQTSYIEPLSKNDFLQFRYSYSANNRNQETHTYNKDAAENYTRFDSLYSNDYENKYINQQIHLSYKRTTDKYNFQVGVNVNPQSSQSIRTHYEEEDSPQLPKRNVTNIGPMAQFQYNFTKSHNIRIDYNTRTVQPSLSQLDPWIDRTDPLNISHGNPYLKPSYTHSLNVRYNLNNRSKMRTLMVFLRGSMTQNSIVSKSVFIADGIQDRTYDNVDGGVWNLMSFVTVNFPINSSFQLNSSSRASMSQNVSLNNGIKNTTQYSQYTPNLGLQFSTLFMDLGVGGTVSFTNTKNSLASQNDQNIRDYDVNAWTTVYLPLNITFVSDISYKTGSG
ncbi:MAG: TonB-dependent receptor, partial [Prevotellaceae bacterium]|nr:TonB-dependent receptor [Prevotellaceae bacterium]